jgi:hypothetical protein
MDDVKLKMTWIQAVFISKALGEARHNCGITEDCFFCAQYQEIEERLRKALSSNS